MPSHSLSATVSQGFFEYPLGSPRYLIALTFHRMSSEKAGAEKAFFSILYQQTS
jgi:hypothetical protein